MLEDVPSMEGLGPSEPLGELRVFVIDVVKQLKVSLGKSVIRGRLLVANAMGIVDEAHKLGVGMMLLATKMIENLIQGETPAVLDFSRTLGVLFVEDCTNRC